MAGEIHFETPENVQISYVPAGPGTRFVAWFMDTLLMFLLALVVFIIALFAGAATDIINREQSGESHHAVMYTLGIFWLVYSLGGFLYFGCCELLMRGQTIGKRSVHIRVVKTDGFSLDPQSIFVRTVFRVVDHLPILYIVPLVTAKGQRLGDLVAGTVVVTDAKTELGGLRDQLAAQRISERRFQFDAAALEARPRARCAGRGKNTRTLAEAFRRRPWAIAGTDGAAVGDTAANRMSPRCRLVYVFERLSRRRISPPASSTWVTRRTPPIGYDTEMKDKCPSCGQRAVRTTDCVKVIRRTGNGQVPQLWTYHLCEACGVKLKRVDEGAIQLPAIPNGTKTPTPIFCRSRKVIICWANADFHPTPPIGYNPLHEAAILSLATLLVCVTVLGVVCALAAVVPIYERVPYGYGSYTRDPANLPTIDRIRLPSASERVRRIGFWVPASAIIMLGALWAVRRLKSRRHTEPPVV